MGEFRSVVPPTEKRQRPNFFGPGGITVAVRDAFTIPTWLAIGGTLQGLLIIALGRFALMPAVLWILYNVLDAYAQAVGFKHNKSLDGIIQGKVSAQIPDELGHYGSKPSNSDVVVLLIGTRCNHPYGLFAPNLKKLGDYFVSMADACHKNAEEFGFLGMTTWRNASERESNSEIMTVAYFSSVEGLHAFAHSDHHRMGWDWWNKSAKAGEMGHLSIFHEVYHVPKGHWENIYINSHRSNILSTTFKITDKETGGPMYASPVVDASKGLLKTSSSRMSRSEGAEHDKLPVADPYDV